MRLARRLQSIGVDRMGNAADALDDPALLRLENLASPASAQRLRSRILSKQNSHTPEAPVDKPIEHLWGQLIGGRERIPGGNI